MMLFDLFISNTKVVTKCQQISGSLLEVLFGVLLFLFELIVFVVYNSSTSQFFLIAIVMYSYLVFMLCFYPPYVVGRVKSALFLYPRMCGVEYCGYKNNAFACFDLWLLGIANHYCYSQVGAGSKKIKIN